MFVLDHRCITKDENIYYSCDWIEHGLVFFPSKIALCCFTGEGEKSHTLIQDNFNGNNFNIDRINIIRNKFRYFHKKGKIHTNCINCPNLKLEAWDERNYIDCLYLSHWINCNSKCIYCYSINHPESFSNNSYKVLGIIKKLLNDGVLKRNSKILFGGGEPALLDEFDDLISFFIDNGFLDIRVHSSGIKYISSLEKGLKEGKIHLTISVDSGSSEVYQRIKNIPCYEMVIENIKRYSSNKMINGESNVSAKYIIIPSINDSKDEIEKWIMANKEANLSFTILDLEENWFLKNKNKIPEKIYDLLKYAKMRSEELGTHFELYERIKRLLD